MWRYLRKMADPDLRQGLLHEGDMNFTNRATGDIMVTWKELCCIASSKGCTIGRLEVETGEQGGRLRLQKLRSKLGLEVFETICATLKPIPQILSVNACHIIRKDEPTAMYVVVCRGADQLDQIPILPRLLMSHPLALVRIVKDRSRQEQGEVVAVQELDKESRKTLLALEPGDCIFPCVESGAPGMVLGEEVPRQHGTIGCFISSVPEEDDASVNSAHSSSELSYDGEGV
jgi:hypothetical protein